MFAIRERVFDDHGADVGAHADLHAFSCGNDLQIRLQLIGEEVSGICGYESADAVRDVGFVGAFEDAVAQRIGHKSGTNKGCGDHKVSFFRNGAANLAAGCSGKNRKSIKKLSFSEHPLEDQAVGSRAITEVEAGLAEGHKDQGGIYFGCGIDFFDGIDHFGRREEVGCFRRCSCREICGLQGFDIWADIGQVVFGCFIVVHNCSFF